MNRKTEHGNTRHPAFDDYLGIKCTQPVLDHPLLLRGGLAILTCMGNGALLKIALATIQSQGANTIGMVIICLGMGTMILALTGFAIWCFRLVTTNAENKANRLSSTKSRDRSNSA